MGARSKARPATLQRASSPTSGPTPPERRISGPTRLGTRWRWWPSTCSAWPPAKRSSWRPGSPAARSPAKIAARSCRDSRGGRGSGRPSAVARRLTVLPQTTPREKARSHAITSTAGDDGASPPPEIVPCPHALTHALWSGAGWPCCSSFLESRAHRGQVIHVAKGPLARHFQRSFGDLLIATSPRSVASVEIKVERRWTGNLFLEVWSNKNLDDRGSHVERGSTPGWLITCRSGRGGVPFYRHQCGAVPTAVQLAAMGLSAWGNAPGRVYDFPERRQRRYAQFNDTWGRIVPIEVLAREVGGGRQASATGSG